MNGCVNHTIIIIFLMRTPSLVLLPETNVCLTLCRLCVAGISQPQLIGKKRNPYETRHPHLSHPPSKRRLRLPLITTWMQRRIWSLHEMRKLRIHTHWSRNLHLSLRLLRVHRQRRSQRIAVSAEEAADFLLRAVCQAGVARSRGQRAIFFFSRGHGWWILLVRGGVVGGQLGLGGAVGVPAERVLGRGRGGAVAGGGRGDRIGNVGLREDRGWGRASVRGARLDGAAAGAGSLGVLVLMNCHGAVSTDLASCDASLAVAEDVALEENQQRCRISFAEWVTYSQQVDVAQDEDENA